MNIVIPMSGRGSRFAKLGISTPKPLIPVAGRPMIAWALESLAALQYTKIYFVALAEHERRYGVVDLLRGIAGSRAEVLLLNEITDGQLCTVLAAREALSEDEDLLIASADTFVVSDLGRDIAQRPQNCRGIISVANLAGDHWSFARTNDDGWVVEVAEKVRISDLASTGLYYFANGREFVSIADRVIQQGERMRGEYYVIPVYTKFIEQAWLVGVSLANEVWDMGTPEALNAFVGRVTANTKISANMREGKP